MSILKKARGSILVMSTLILSVLAGLSISTLQNIVTEYQLTAQNQDKTLALQAAQYAISEAKRLLLSNWSVGAPTCASISGCTGSNGIAVWSYSAFAGTTDLSKQAPAFFNDAQATTSSPNPKVAASPRFFVINLGCDPYSKSNIYRIAALGFGASINTVAYAESQFTMPLSGQNSYSGATTQAVPAFLDNVQVATYNLALSTNTKTLFFNNSAPASCPQGTGTGATCEMNCLGEVRVKGYSYFNTNSTSCPWIYGDWVAAGSNTMSTISLQSSGGATHTVGCQATGTNNCTVAQNLAYSCCLANQSTSGATCTPPTCTTQPTTCPACSDSINQLVSCCIANMHDSSSNCLSYNNASDCRFSSTSCPPCSASINSTCCWELMGSYTNACGPSQDAPPPGSYGIYLGNSNAQCVVTCPPDTPYSMGPIRGFGGGGRGS